MSTPVAARAGRRISAGFLWGANRLVQLGIVVALSMGVRRRDPSVLLNGLLSLAFAALPAQLERRYGARFRLWQRLWISAAAFVHTIGMLGPYDRVWWWDHLAHALSGVVVGGTVDVYLRATAAETGRSPLSGRFRSVAILGVTMGVGLLWEALEYVVHAVADRLGFEPLLVHYGRRDTVGDLLFDGLGAALVIVFGRSALSNVVESVTDE